MPTNIDQPFTKEKHSQTFRGRMRIIASVALLLAGWGMFPQNYVTGLAPAKSAKAEIAPSRRPDTKRTNRDGRPRNRLRYEMLLVEYDRLFQTAEIPPGYAKAVRQARDRLLAGKIRYEGVAKELGIPWWFVGIVHELEASGDFSRHQHNGDTLKRRTVNVPAQRPIAGQPPFTWEESATDAHRQKGHDKIESWSLSRALYELERFNGFGYRRKGVPSPYLWSYTHHYARGKFVADGEYDPHKVSKQVGAAALLKSLVDGGYVRFSDWR